MRTLPFRIFWTFSIFHSGSVLLHFRFGWAIILYISGFLHSILPSVNEHQHTSTGNSQFMSSIRETTSNSWATALVTLSWAANSAVRHFQIMPNITEQKNFFKKKLSQLFSASESCSSGWLEHSVDTSRQMNSLFFGIWWDQHKYPK